jgi:subtilase family serine protease
MATEGFRKSGRTLLVLLAALVVCGPACAQHLFTILPRQVQGDENPGTFMRPQYQIQLAAASSEGGPPSTAFAPSEMRHAYGFDQISNQGAGQIIGIVDAYDDPNAEADLGVFDAQFGLPPCTSTNGCFRKVYSNGQQPAANPNWAVEIALDIEWAHSIAPQATILLVETPTNSLTNLLAGVETAVRNGASAVSMSWTVGEFPSESSYDNQFVASGVTFLAAAGDNGTGVSYPAASPDVVGVGGTSLHLASNGNYQNETAWGGSGGGLSKFEREPPFQAQFPIPYDWRGYRSTPDVSFDADPGTGVAVYDSVGVGGNAGWFQIGGTSAGTPQWAALIAIVDETRAAAGRATLSSADTCLYAIAKSAVAVDFNSVTTTTNGSFGTLFTAGTSYHFITGLGTPQASALIAALAAW